MANEILKYSFPWHGNGIYLESNDNQAKAVCSSKEIAKYLAAAVNNYEYRDDYLQTALDFQKKAMVLIENTNSINAALNAVDNAFEKLDTLSSKHVDFINQMSNVSCLHQDSANIINQLSSTANSLSNEIDQAKKQINEFSRECQQIDSAMFALNNNQQALNKNLIATTAMQHSISQKFDQLSSQQNMLNGSLAALNQQKENICSKINEAANNYISCKDDISQLKIQNNVLRNNIDEVNNDQITLSKCINEISSEQANISDNLDFLKSQNIDNAEALEAFNNFIDSNTRPSSKDFSISLSSKDLENYIVSAKCLLMVLKSVKIDTSGLNMKVLQLSYTDFLNKVLEIEKFLNQKRQEIT